MFAKPYIANRQMRNLISHFSASRRVKIEIVHLSFAPPRSAAEWRLNVIKIKEAIVVEGKYDKIKLSSIYDTIIISVNGFNIFNDLPKQAFIRNIAEKSGIIIFTDSDRAGFLIRNFLCGIIDNMYIKHAYIPQVEGKEKRKDAFSKDGFLGVEGIDKESIINGINNAATVKTNENKKPITKADLYLTGVCGKPNSKILRDKLLDFLGLPKGITTNPLLNILNSLYGYDEYYNLVEDLFKI